jgi:hypothetical protein
MTELSSPLARLAAFRAELYACCARRADALLELADALLCAPAIPSVAHLSLEPVHRRGWGSAYAALARGHLDAEQLRDLLADTHWMTASRSTRSTPPAGRAATPTAARSAACTTTPRGTRPASRSWPAGPTSGSPSSASPATAGPRRWTRAACTPTTTTTRSPSPRSARCCNACPPAGRCRCSCSTPATIPLAWRWGWPMRPPRSWCGYARGAASTPTRHRGLRPARAAGPAATAPSWTPATRPPGRHQASATSRTTASTVACRCRPGPGCIPSSNSMPPEAPDGRGPSSAAPWCACRSSGSPPTPAHLRCCGCGGTAPARPTWRCYGGPTCAASTWK